MRRTLILVAAPPACGKNYVSEMICRALGQTAYLDKDDLGVLLRRSFALCDEQINMDGAFYQQHLRDAEYATLMELALTALRFSPTVLVNAPFLKEVRDATYMRELKRRAAAWDAQLLLVWVTASAQTCYERMKARNSDRDGLKLAGWEAYVAGTDYSAPYALAASGAVDRVFVFDNENDQTAAACLQELLELIGG